MAWTKIPTYTHPQIFSNSFHFITPQLDPKMTKQSVKQIFKILKNISDSLQVCQECTSSIKCILFPIYTLKTKYTPQLSSG